MKEGIQTLLGEAGEAACYALDILEIAERERGLKLNIIECLCQGIDRGYIYYNGEDPNDNDNFFVEDPAALLAMFAGGRWAVEKAGPDYVPARGEYVVDRWERVRTGAVIGHFRLPDWDSLHNSMTVRYGKIVSKRIFRRTG
ncbi:MAG: DUF261 domain-containing protein [Treponema sp.]|jgi:hypothetical protein|nr:DUF261 domain-containing protein [Treponema sp.]